MKYKIEHEVPGRVRISLSGTIPNGDVDALSDIIGEIKGVSSVKVFPKIGSIAIKYGSDASSDKATQEMRSSLLSSIEAIGCTDIEQAKERYPMQLATRTSSLLTDIASLVSSHLATRYLLPAPIRYVWTSFKFLKFLKAALDSLLHARLDVPVLDAAAVGISFIKGDLKTASNTMFLLQLGETLERYTQARSQNELIYSLMAIPEKVNMLVNGEEVQVLAQEVSEGDVVVIRTGMPVCVDGTVISGTAMVNQANLTGEPLAIERTVGDGVFAGTAVEDGEIQVRARAGASNTKLRSIVSLVEQSELLKGQAQSKRENLANKIVPWNFLLAGIVALSTRSLIKTSAALMVDYSCALKLTGSIAVLSALSQSAHEGFTVKGSRSLEALASADTIVFDKTGTLTNAEPKVSCVLAFEGWDQTRVLRYAACLEEHFPHPVARAVVNEASEQGLKHRERHAEVEYLVAHGIASSLEGKRIVIGSEHFVVEDEHVEISDEQRLRIQNEANSSSVLYLAVDGELVGVIGIDDPLKDEVPDAISRLRKLGFENIVMLTGDNKATATRIASQAGITRFEANMLPEGKHEYVEKLKAEGHTVAMVGDGINDSPALSAADVGIAMGGSTAIAREVADITLASGSLEAIIRLKIIADELMKRLDSSFAQIMAINSALLALGIASVITPQMSSLAHNGGTVVMSLASSRKYGKSYDKPETEQTLLSAGADS